MEKFEALLKIYFDKPYRPEYLVKKIKKEIKNSNYDFVLEKETKNDVINENFEKLFIPIFSNKKESIKNYIFNNEVEKGESIANFKNFVYESCKSDYNSIKKKEILLYLFILEEFKDRIIKTIYDTALNKTKDDIYEQLLNKFLSPSDNSGINKSIFDDKYLKNFLNNNGEKNEIISQEQAQDSLFNTQNDKINFLKYEYYGPEYTKYNYILNKPGENDPKKIILYTPDYLLSNKIFDKYSGTNFQVFNASNTCPGLFTYILEEGIKQLNNKLNGEIINDDIINNFGIIYFKDQTVGFYLNANDTTGYYEIKNLYDNLRTNNTIENLEVVSCSSISKEDIKGGSKKKNLTNEQKNYSEYNSHVFEEQLSLSIINALGGETENNEIEKLPRIIFYFNLYLIESKKIKQTFAFPAREDAYGFEEADGIFYSSSKDVILNENGDIPFFHNLRYVFNPGFNSIEIDQRNKINLEQNSFIYMEVKTSFPLKYNGQNELEGFPETKNLIKSIMRKSKKFYEIAENKKKIINTIHILFLYDSLLPNDKDMLEFQKQIGNIMNQIKEEIEIKTIFDIIYFVNPASINMRKFSNMVKELKKENKEVKKLMEQNKLEIENFKEANEKQMNTLKEQNIELKKENKEVKKLMEQNKLEIENFKEANEKQMNTLKEQNIELKKENDFFKKQIESLNEKIKQLENQIKGTAYMSQNNINKNNEYSTNKDIENKEEGNMITKANDKIKEDNEEIYNIQVLKNGTICLGGKEKVYIIKDNLDIETLLGFRKVILPLKNGDLLSSKFRKIYIHFYNNISNYRNISMQDCVKQIIELKENNKLLILLENENLSLMKDEVILKTIDDYNKYKNILSIVEINANEIAILINNQENEKKDNEKVSEKYSPYKFLIFYDLIKYEEIKRLNLKSKTLLNNVEIFYVYNNYLYVSLSDALFVIDIERKIQEI